LRFKKGAKVEEDKQVGTEEDNLLEINQIMASRAGDGRLGRNHFGKKLSDY